MRSLLIWYLKNRPHLTYISLIIEFELPATSSSSENFMPMNLAHLFVVGMGFIF